MTEGFINFCNSQLLLRKSGKEILMKNSKKLVLLLIPVVLTVSVVLFVFVQNRTLSKNIMNIPDMIYVPNGMADKYNDLYSGFTDGHIIWEYSLNHKEKEKIESELDNGIWNQITNEATSELIYGFTFNSKSYFPDDISEDAYYCIYDFGQKRFISSDENLSVLGWHRAYFIFDKTNSQYYCSDLEI